MTLHQEWDEGHRLTAQTTRVGAKLDKITATLSPGMEQPGTHRRTYGYRADGYPSVIEDTATGRRTFDLDEVGRITAVHARGWTERYAYDLAGNVTYGSWPGRTTRTQGDREVGGTLLRRAGRTKFEYDAQGRVIRKSHRTLSGKSKTWTFAWDADDLLAEVAIPDGTVWKYTYDPLGRRTAKHHVVDTGARADEVLFTWDGTHLAEQEVEGVTTSWDYSPGTHRPLTQTAAQTDVDTQFFAVVTDLIGAPLHFVTENGIVCDQTVGTVWGTTVQSSGGPRCPMYFPGSIS